MRTVIAGGHGQIALILERILADRGDEPVGLVRNPDHAADLADAGAETVVIDFESATVSDVAQAIKGADAVVFAAGGGPDGNAARKETVDKGAAIMLAQAAEEAGVRRYVMISAISVDDFDPASDDVFQVYLRAKSEADADLRSRDLDWTIVRPGRLTDDPGTGRVHAGRDVSYGEIPRADVAAVLAAVLADDATIGKQFDLVSGDQGIVDALRSLG